MYDPVLNEWTEPVIGVILPHEREKHCMVPVGKKVYVIGGKLINKQNMRSRPRYNFTLNAKLNTLNLDLLIHVFTFFVIADLFDSLYRKMNVKDLF